MSNYLSREAAIKNLEDFFRNTSADVIDVDDIFVQMGRDLKTDKANRSWLSNKLTAMKEYNFLTRQYSKRDNKNKLTKLSLTSEGKRVLGRAEEVQTTTTTTTVAPDNSSSTAVSRADVESLLESVNRDIEVLQQKLPSFYITFNIRPRRDVSMSERLNRTIRKL